MTAGVTLRFALALLALVAPSVVVRELALIVLVMVPLWLSPAVTGAVIVHEEFAGMTPPESVIDVVVGVVTEPPEQVVAVAPPELVRPVGKLSVRLLTW